MYQRMCLAVRLFASLFVILALLAPFVPAVPAAKADSNGVVYMRMVSSQNQLSIGYHAFKEIACATPWSTDPSYIYTKGYSLFLSGYDQKIRGSAGSDTESRLTIFLTLTDFCALTDRFGLVDIPAGAGFRRLGLGNLSISGTYPVYIYDPNAPDFQGPLMAVVELQDIHLQTQGDPTVMNPEHVKQYLPQADGTTLMLQYMTHGMIFESALTGSAFLTVDGMRQDISGDAFSASVYKSASSVLLITRH